MNPSFYKKCPALNAMRQIAEPTSEQLRAGLMELSHMVSGMYPPTTPKPPKSRELVTILTFRSKQPHFIVQGKLHVLFGETDIPVFVEREDQVVRFVTFKGISENERMALEDIIKSLQIIFGKE